MPAARQRLTLRIPAEHVARAEALLALCGAESLALHDAGDEPVLEPAPGETPLWSDVELRAVLGAEVDAVRLLRCLDDAFGAGAAAIAPLDERAWRDAARAAIPAREFGRRLWVAPAGSGAAPPNRVPVFLNMGLAFGTGEHPTTALCLEWLDARLERGAHVLDYGCGSGVLALAAVALGAAHAWAVDNDPQALAATAANVLQNAAAAARVTVAAPADLPRVAVDVVVANILAGPLVTLAPELAERLVPGGRIALTGVLERQADAVVAAYAARFTALEQRARDGWVLIEGVRRGA